MEILAKGTAMGKIILMGEHAVIYNQPAVALPFPAVKVTCTIATYDGPLMIDSDYFVGPLSEVDDNLSGIKTIIFDVLKFLEKPNKNLRIIIDSSIPSSRGLGSSAAVSVAIIKALFQAFDTDLSNDILYRFARMAEDIHHHRSSGLDVNAVCAGKPLYFKKGEDSVYFDIRFDGVLVICDTGIMGHTSEAVKQVKSFVDQKKDLGTKIINQLGALSNQAMHHLQNNDFNNLSDVMNEGHQYLSQLGVCAEANQIFVDVAKASGASAAKLTGSGLGGCNIALCRNQDIADGVMTNLLMAGAKEVWSYSLKETLQ